MIASCELASALPYSIVPHGYPEHKVNIGVWKNVSGFVFLPSAPLASQPGKWLQDHLAVRSVTGQVYRTRKHV